MGRKDAFVSTFVHFIDVGQGNMTLLRLPNGEVILYDCNVTDEHGSLLLELKDDGRWSMRRNS
jgi:beta-lactamase superfamily II metal-dependent hydrolase